MKKKVASFLVKMISIRLSSHQDAGTIKFTRSRYRSQVSSLKHQTFSNKTKKITRKTQSSAQDMTNMN